jgi:hypothetical protein
MKDFNNTSNNYYNINNIKNPHLKKHHKILSDSLYHNTISTNFVDMRDDLNNRIYRALSKKKDLGVFDSSSPGNKDVLIDSDSELPLSTRTKNIEKGSGNHNKKGCTKLIIKKVENQMPKRNEEYFKITNKKRYLNQNNIKFNNNGKKFNDINKSKNDNVSHNGKRTVSKTNKKNCNTSNNFDNKKNNNQNYIKNYKNDIQNGSKDKGSVLGSYYNKNENNLLNTVSTEKDNNINSTHKKYRNSLFNNSKRASNNMPIEFLNYNSNTNHSPYIQKSTMSSVANGSENSINFIENNIISSKKNITKESEYSSYYRGFSTNKDSYQSKREKRSVNKNMPPKHFLLNNANHNNITKNPKVNINYDTNKTTYLQNKFKEKLIKCATKIQSFWRGAFIRELMTFVGRLNAFINAIHKIFHSQLKLNYYYFLLKI